MSRGEERARREGKTKKQKKNCISRAVFLPVAHSPLWKHKRVEVSAMSLCLRGETARFTARI